MGVIKRPSDGREAKSVVFIQSPDTEDDNDFAYTGAVTSLVALKQAKYVREDFPADGKAFVFYQREDSAMGGNSWGPAVDRDGNLYYDVTTDAFGHGGAAAPAQ